MPKLAFFWILPALICVTNFAFAKPYDLSHLTVSQFDADYQALLEKQQTLENQLAPESWKYINNKSMRHKLRLSKTQWQLTQEYLQWQNQWTAFAPVINFRDDLINLYSSQMQTQPDTALVKESTLIALTLVSKTHVLRKQFNMSFIPIWQNFLINIKIRKRGFCYHWANDLLETIIPLERNYFNVTWSESGPGTLSEHNVATLFPKGKEYKDGLFFDPWRTGGKPFWRSPLKDPHFNWKKRPEYGTY
jgi:hypothetical protein